MNIWKKRSQEEINQHVFGAIAENVNYVDENILGVPASYLDEKVFPHDSPLLKDAPYLSTLIQNPNHIGCHTLGKSESFFSGTHKIERELIEICAVDILKGEKGQIDGYVASGGTEANLQAIWIYRNFYQRMHQADRNEICILCSEDSHYSMDKAANVLAIDIFKVAVEDDTRKITAEAVEKSIEEAKAKGKKFFIVIANMMTTMFGSVDDVQLYVDGLKKGNCEYKIHADGAYGGFYYPFAKDKSLLDFSNPEINSVTLDAHKMAQAPYGTGIFLIRKNWMHHANTQEASYVEGEDFTLIGSRSGANAIAVWMILSKHGPFGWREKIYILQKRTEWMCEQLKKLNLTYYNHASSNIITIRAAHISPAIAKQFVLVPDNHDRPEWYKIVIMEHVTIERLLPLVEAIASR